MSDDLKPEIIDNAEGPKRMKGDEGEIEQHSLPDQIAADKYAKGITGVDTQTRGLRFNKFKPPGAA